MQRYIIFLLGFYYTLTAFTLLIFPLYFYENTPGVNLTGSYNEHFIRDFGLALLTSAFTLFWGAYYKLRDIAMLGAVLPLLHGLYHIIMWFSKGLPLDFIAFADWCAVILPGTIVFALTTQLKEQN